MATFPTREAAIKAAVKEQTLRQIAQGQRFSSFALKLLLG